MTDTKRCPYCAEQVRIEAIKCRHCGSRLGDLAAARGDLYRRDDDKMIAGVCSGLADYFNLPVAIVRLAFVLTTLFTGVGIVVYVVLWIVMPMDEWRGDLDRALGQSERDAPPDV